MANNLTTQQELITQMEAQWTGFRCFPENDQTPDNTFLFGYPQEKDQHHVLTGTTMVVNPPSTSVATIDIQKEVVKYNTKFTLQIYRNIPSDTFGMSNSNSYPRIWDNMEMCFYQWLQNTLTAMGSRVEMGSGSVSITRRNQSSNDQQFQIECSFNLDYWFTCINLI